MQFPVTRDACPGDLVTEILGEFNGFALVKNAQDDNELFSAKPGCPGFEPGAVAARIEYSPGGRHQYGITDKVAVKGVEALEVVDVQENDRNFLAAAFFTGKEGVSSPLPLVGFHHFHAPGLKQ